MHFDAQLGKGWLWSGVEQKHFGAFEHIQSLNVLTPRIPTLIDLILGPHGNTALIFEFYLNC